VAGQGMLICAIVTCVSGCGSMWPVASHKEPPRGTWTGTLLPVVLRSLENDGQRVILAELTVSDGARLMRDARDDEGLDVTGWHALLVNKEGEPIAQEVLAASHQSVRVTGRWVTRDSERTWLSRTKAERGGFWVPLRDQQSVGLYSTIVVDVVEPVR
jgi:hypothetical protein